MARLLSSQGKGMDHVVDVLQGSPNRAAIVVVGMNGVLREESYHCEMVAVLGDLSSEAHLFD